MNDQEEPSTNREDAAGDVRVGSGETTAALVQITEELAVVYGDHLPHGAEFIPFTLIDDATRSSMSAAVATAAGFGNLAAQGVQGAMQAQGLVRLAPQTVEQLKNAAPLVKDGWNLGTLASEGKFVAQVRWLPAGGASAASVIASMGPAITLMAIQFQLNQIADVAQHNVELTTEVLRVVRQDQWSQVTGYHRTLVRELHNAQEIGMVSDSIYNAISGYQGTLDTQRDIFEKAIKAHISELRVKQGHRERQQYLIDHGEAIVADVQALLLAQTSWFIYQSLRAGHLLRSAESDSQDKALMDKLIKDAKAIHEKTLNETDQLLEELAREFAIIGELQGKRTIKIGGSARAARDSARMVRQLQDAVTAVRGQQGRAAQESLTLPSLRVFADAVPAELTRVLPLRLRQDEYLLALADARCDRWDLHLRSSGWVAITNERILIAKQEPFRRFGAIDVDLDHRDIRYVRRRVEGDKPPAVEITTTDHDVTIKFESWAKTGSHRAAAERVSELIASFMRLPASEIPAVDVPTLTPSPAPPPQLTL